MKDNQSRPNPSEEDKKPATPVDLSAKCRNSLPTLTMCTFGKGGYNVLHSYRHGWQAHSLAVAPK